MWEERGARMECGMKGCARMECGRKVCQRIVCENVWESMLFDIMVCETTDGV